MTRVLKTALLIVLFYVLPLLGAPERILNPRILVLITFCAVLFLTQPELDFGEARRSRTDRLSMFVILGAGAAAQLVPVIEWGYFGDAAVTPGDYPWLAAGAFMLVGGLVFRIWAIRALGRHFTVTVEVASDQRVITRGPYAVVRHPSYLGALVAIVGSAVFLRAPVGAGFALVAMLLAYGFRIVVEEQALVTDLGEPYRVYQRSRRFRLIPGLW